MPEINNLPSCLIAVSQLPGWASIPATSLTELRKAGERFGSRLQEHTDLSAQIVKSQIAMGKELSFFRKHFQQYGLWIAFQESNGLNRSSVLRWINEYEAAEKLAEQKQVSADILETAIAGGLKELRPEIIDQLPPPPKRASASVKHQYAMELVRASRIARKGRGKAIRSPEAVIEKCVQCVYGYVDRLPADIRYGAIIEIIEKLQTRYHPNRKAA